MDAYSLLLLGGLLFIGTITSREDFHYGRIRNKWMLLALGYSVILTVLASLFLFANGMSLSKTYLIQYALNIAFAFLLGVIIWVAGLWSAGDAKLFLAFAALMPLSVYQQGYVQSFPAFTILVNTLVPMFVVYTVAALLRTTLKQKIAVLREVAAPAAVVRSMLIIFAFSWGGYLVARWIAAHSPLVNTVVAMLCGVIVLGYLLGKMGVDMAKVAGVVAAIALLTDYRNIATSHFLLSFALTFVLAWFVRQFVLHLGYGVFSHPVFIEDLKPGMLPAENFLQLGERGIVFRKKKVLHFGFLSDFMEKTEGNLLFKAVREGIAREEAEKARKFHSERFLRHHTVRIYQTMPFAPFLFGGALLTFLAQGSIIALLA